MHGSDIYNAVDAIVRDADAGARVGQLVFRHFGRRDCDMVWEKPGGESGLVAQGSVIRNGDRQPFWIVESQRPVNDRYAFDEDGLVSAAVIDGEEIALGQRSGYTPIEEIIALTKRLNYELTPDVDGKWVFGQLNLRRAIPTDYSAVKIRRTHHIAGRFSVNQIVVDDEALGDIRFIVGKP